ncbi:MAG: hypothetical protein GFH27_549279n508 [Chloroflexi bacterium AL-W]|nr:hypothetical protein [Chloroflexi bacterium AL-N1]NOK65473.1 hypothetical protein [Chloroflexi bacterium AL-N10]NOK72261.1 hypothetical protein [Chloroflexi bacterium AL-N5]NOK79653.1 hypothetical protein [Chloroflexi bacterium AL-W]NOK87568.1 hypothetical protein [Chloroflexi bacterium AL-N15]
MQFTDNLPTGLTNISNVNVIASGIPAPSIEISGTTLLVPDSADDTFDLLQSAVVTITFDAEIDTIVTPGQTITNTGSVTWTSVEGDNPDERTSGDGPINGGGLNDYETDDDVAFDIDNAAFSKALESTSASHTTGNDLTIGEIVMYTLAITLPEGIVPSLQVIDQLPEGLAYVVGTLSIDTGNFNGSVPAASVTAGGDSGDDITIDFGVITTTADNDATNNTFTLRFQAQVMDEDDVIGLNPPGQTTLVNRATLQISSQPTIPSNDVNVTVVEPQMEISKTFNPDRAAANDVVQVTLIVTNTGYIRGI